MKTIRCGLLLGVILCAGLLVFPSSGADGATPVYIPQAAPLTADNPAGQTSLPTVTVRGFLNFRTTVDGTVIVFTPASQGNDPSASPPSNPEPPTHTKPPHQGLRADSKEGTEIQDLSNHNPVGVIKTGSELLDNEATGEQVKGHHEAKAAQSASAAIFNTRTQAPSFLQTSAPVLLTKVVSGTNAGPTPVLPQYPTGLVTVLGGTHVQNGATTVHETKVIGTYIDGKYAQILQSTSRIYAAVSSGPYAATQRPDIAPSPSFPIQQHTSSASLLNGHVSSSRVQVSSSSRTLQNSNPEHQPNALNHKDDSISTNTVLQSSFKVPENTPQRSSNPTQSLDRVRHSSPADSVLTRPLPSRTQPLDEDNTVLHSRRNNQQQRLASLARSRYTLPRRRNSQTVRLNRFKVKLTVRQDQTASPDDELENENGEDDPLISVDPARVVYERATITSLVTLHVGRRKSVRTLTITTSVQRTLEPSESFFTNGLVDPREAAAANNALTATSLVEGETPPLVISRTYSTTERTWRTSLVPFFDGLSTTVHTVTESFFIRKLITAYRTMPPGDLVVLDQSMDSESELPPDSGLSLQTVLLQGVVPLPPSPQQQLLQTPLPHVPTLDRVDSSYLALSSPQSGTLPLSFQNNPLQNNNNNNNALLSLGAALTNNPLAAVYLGLQQLNRQVTQYITVTRPSSYVTTDTVYSTKVVSFYDGRHTRSRTLSEPISTTERTVTSMITTVEPYINTQALQQQQQLQQLIGTQLPPALPPPIQFTTITSSYTTVTTATSLSTKVYTLIYNAFSTKFRTVTSTSLYETTISTYKTTEVPIQPTAAIGGLNYPLFG